ncbi:MAG: hypothetical protein L0Y80_12365 [Ignavibacteriae bacterium]|nr:hypothetical protein [Ignavibacteriota bacterium]
MKKYITVIITVVSLSIAALQGCMEEPNAVGSKILPPSDLLQLDTTSNTAVGTSVIAARPNITSPANILVGSADGFESWALLRFTTMPDSLLFTRLVDAEIQLQTTYHFGDSAALLSFDVHQALVSWSGDSLTIDSLQVPGFFDPTPSSSFSMSPVADTAIITIPIDTTIVRQWINSVLDTTTTNWGVLLKPTNTSVIKGFATDQSSNSDWQPKLVTRFIQPDSVDVDTATITGSAATYTAFRNTPAPPDDESRIYIQNGIATRGMINLDISSLPAKATIHKAVLDLTLDQQASRLNSHSRDSVSAFFVDTTGSAISILAISELVSENGQKVYRLSVTNAVQVWIQRDDLLRRLLIAGYAENSTLDSFVFYGVQSNFPPKLTITYSPVQ